MQLLLQRLQQLQCFWSQRLDVTKFIRFWCVQVESQERKNPVGDSVLSALLQTFDGNMSSVLAVCVFIYSVFINLCSLFSSLLFQRVCQGARVVVSRSFADFTPQATFDIKVPFQKSKTKPKTQ